jgi:hypothetical protein
VRRKETPMLRRDEDGKLRLPPEELEGSSFDDLTAGLADVTITRARALKLGGAALAGSAFTLLWPAEADARRRKKRRKKKRRNKVRTNPAQVDFGNQQAGIPSPPSNVTITNPRDDTGRPVFISPELGNGFTFAPNFTLPTGGIAEGNSLDVPIIFTPTTPGVTYSGQLLVVNANDAPLATVTLEGTAVSASV